jgi:hypothetical protein
VAGQGGSCPPPKKRLQSRKVGQMFNKSRAKSGKLKSQKAKKPPVCWANKGSRAIFSSQSGNIGLLQKERGQIMRILWLISKNFVIRNILYVRKNFWTPKMVHCPKFFW